LHSIAASPSTPRPTGSAPSRAPDSYAGRAADGCRPDPRPAPLRPAAPAAARPAPTNDQWLAAWSGLRAKTCQGVLGKNNPYTGYPYYGYSQSPIRGADLCSIYLLKCLLPP